MRAGLLCSIMAAALALAVPAQAQPHGAIRWPESASTRVQLAAVERVVRRLEDRLELMQLSVARYAAWEACVRGVPVSEVGDPDRQWGFLYDERDGSGPSFMPALAVDRRRPNGREDYLFLDFGRSAACRSAAPKPGGTADAASARPSPSSGPSPPPGHTLRALERRVRLLRLAIGRVASAAERFDAWESCVSWVPVTEYGDPDGGFGYRYGRWPSAPTYRPALSIDRSDWDDPDYLFLAFVGGDRPGGACQNEPGEADD